MTEFTFKPVSLIALTPESLDEERRKSRRLVDIQSFVPTTGHLVNYQALDETDLQLVDDGDLPPAWIYWWLTLVTELCCSKWSESSALILPDSNQDIRSTFAKLLNPVSSYQVIPLTVGDICFAIGSAAWSLSTDIAVAWGVEGSQFNHPHIPLPCRGAIIPTADGLGAICIANEADRRLLHTWIANENL